MHNYTVTGKMIHIHHVIFTTIIIADALICYSLLFKLAT